MLSGKPGHIKAVLLALLVTILWATSFILVKLVIKDIPAITFAGLRYFIAFLCLLPFGLSRSTRNEIGSLNRIDWMKLIGVGLLYYSVTQAAIFVGLSHLPAMSVNLILNISPVLVTLLGIVLLAEKPAMHQGLGVLANLAGVLIYFLPAASFGGAWVGLAAMVLALVGNSFSVILNRVINRSQRYSVMTLTLITMGFGSIVMLVGGVLIQGLPPIPFTGWAIILWMAIVNTALAFTLWNYTLRTLKAMESSIINGAMLIEIAVLAWIFLGEAQTPVQITGLALAGTGGLLVQLKRNGSKSKQIEPPMEIG
ncbi:MAG: DMT family transporter [Anaerolineaceae bacterium]